MIRTLALAAFVTLFGAGASQAQYQDSAPPDEQNRSPYGTVAPEGYDEELLGPYQPQQYYDDQQYDDRYSDGGYSRPDVDVGIFANLSNGRWFMSANFGWVWRPYAATSWRPYTNGRWVWTSYGWTWVSYEPFGWATYHYGYWNCDSALGWVWIPGYEWSACRVQWAYYDNYVAWAPMYPPGYACPRPFTTAGFNIWFTIGANHFCDPYPVRYRVTPSYKNVYAQRVAYKSPARTYVQQYSHTTIRESTVKFKNTTVVRGSKSNFNRAPSQTVVKTKSSSTRQPYVQNSRPNVQSKQKLNGGSQQYARDTRTYVQNTQPQRTKQQLKSSSQRKSTIDARAMQQRQRDPGITRQYQARETKQKAVVRSSTSRSSQVTRGGGQSQSSKQFTGGGGAQKVQRQAPSRDAQRPVATHGSSKQTHGNVAKMKGGNGKGAGKR